MRQLPNILAEIIHHSGLRLNTISKTSGISHAYLTKLVRGGINRPGKDKIASVLLSLNHTIAEINTVLSEYDYQPLSREDIPEILKNNRKRKIEGHVLPQFDHVYFELLIAAMEGIGGTKILVKNRPSGIFIPDDLYLINEYPFEADRTAQDFRYDLTLALIRERKHLFLDNCAAGHRFETFICTQCLDDYLNRQLDPAREPHRGKNRQAVVHYFASALNVILRAPAQHRTHLVERCGFFHFQIQDAEGERPIVSFPGRKPHHFDNPHEQMNLQGFSSDAPAMLALFNTETALCRAAALPVVERDYPDALVSSLTERFDRYGLGGELTAAVETLLRVDRLTFL